MATTIKLKNSVTTTNAPSSLAQGEVAINITDKKVWVGNAATTPIQLLGDGGSVNFTTVDTTNLQVTNIKAKDGTASASIANSTGAFTVAAAFAANGGATLGDASGDALTINSSAVSIPNGLNFDSDTLVIDATNNRVGIGTSSPSGRLHVTQDLNGTNWSYFTNPNVNSSAAVALNLYTDSGGGDFRLIVNNSTNTGASGASGVRLFNHSTSGVLAFGTNATERMRITSIGAVAINTTDTTITGGAVGSSSQFVVSGTVGRVQISNTGNEIAFSRNSANYISANAGSSAGLITGAQSYLRFDTGTTLTERMRIDTSGNVGIGTSSPAYKLHVSNYMGLGTQASAGSGAGINIIPSSTLTNWFVGANYNISGAFEITPSTAGGGSTFSTPSFLINSSGNVGIGTSSPAYRLDVNAPASNNGVIALRAGVNLASYVSIAGNNNTPLSGSFDLIQDQTLAYVYQRANAPMTFGTNNTERMRITSGGDVGIGTTAPNSKLDVSNLGTNTSVAMRLSSNDSGGNSVRTVFTQNADGSFTTNVNQGNNGSTTAMIFQQAGTERMRIDSSGNVGIGTTAPQAVLDLGTGTSGRGLTWGGNAGANRYASIFAPFSNGGIVLGASFYGSASADSYLSSYTGTTYANGIRLNVFDAAGIQFFTDGSASKTAGAAFTPTERMRITSGGEVYIAGTTDQGAYNLQVNGTGVWGAGAYVNGSDERIKDKIAPLDSGLDVVAKLNPVTYKYKEDWSKDQSTQTGFIAQELLTALEGKNYVDGVVQQGGEYMSVAYQNIIPILTKAIQEQQAMIKELKQEVALLKSK